MRLIEMKDIIDNNWTNIEKEIALRKRNNLTRIRSRQLALAELVELSNNGWGVRGLSCDGIICDTMMTSFNLGHWISDNEKFGGLMNDDAWSLMIMSNATITRSKR